MWMCGVMIAPLRGLNGWEWGGGDWRRGDRGGRVLEDMEASRCGGHVHNLKRTCPIESIHVIVSDEKSFLWYSGDRV